MMRKIETGDDILCLLRQLNISIRQCDFGGECRGLTRKLNDGYLVLIQEGLCYDSMIKTVKHELFHIILGHLDDDIKTISEKEQEVKNQLAKKGATL